MKKLNILAAVIAASLASSTVFATEAELMKCKVLDKQGQGLIQAGKGESTAGSGQNQAHDPEAWIMVPADVCTKLNAGDFTGISEEIKSKIEH